MPLFFTKPTEPPHSVPTPTTQQPIKRPWVIRNRFVILFAIGSVFVLWLFEVLVFTNTNQSGIICLTPVAWVLSTIVGLRVALYSHSQENSARLKQAYLAGAVFGVFLGMVYTVDVLIVGRNDPANFNFALISGLIMILVGAVVCGFLAFIVAALMIRRMRLNSTGS